MSRVENGMDYFDRPTEDKKEFGRIVAEYGHIYG
jgi:hypothetical protein